MFNPIGLILSSIGSGFWVRMFATMAFFYANMGLIMSLTFAVIALLRPITNRLIAPRWRVWIWFVGWYGCFLSQIYTWLGKVPALPVSFRSLVVPRTQYVWNEDLTPAFLPALEGPGDYTVLLPGGFEFPISISETFVTVLGLLWIGLFIGLMILDHRQNRRLRRIGRQGVKMDEEQRARYGIDRDNVVVRLCKDLPTSFVRFGNDEHFGDGTRFVICVQDDLPEEQMRLVLLHEMEHVKQHHAWWKSTITCAMYLYGWNPLLWLGYRLTCRDMELACDEAVMAKLDERDRREYARTLVELAAGRPMWGSMTSFGECDAALRIRRVVNWKPATALREGLSVALMLVLILFFYCGSWDMSRMQERADSLNWIWYTNGSPLELDFCAIYAERMGKEPELKEVWEAEPTEELEGVHFLYVRDQDGNWYELTCVRVKDGYDIIHHAPTTEPDVEGMRGLVIPADKMK